MITKDISHRKKHVLSLASMIHITWDILILMENHISAWAEYSVSKLSSPLDYSISVLPRALSAHFSSISTLDYVIANIVYNALCWSSEWIQRPQKSPRWWKKGERKASSQTVGPDIVIVLEDFPDYVVPYKETELLNTLCKNFVCSTLEEMLSELLWETVGLNTLSNRVWRKK